MCGEYFCTLRWNGRELHLHFHLSMHVRRHTGCHGYKMALVVAARARRRSVCRRLLRLSRKICLMFPAASSCVCNCLKFGRESVHLCKWNTYQTDIGRGKGTFLRGDGSTSAHTDLRCIAKYVIEWGSSKRGDKTGRSCSFLEMNE